MYTFAVRLLPKAGAKIDPEMIKCVITVAAVPEDHLEHTYVQAAPSGFADIVLYLNLPTLEDAQARAVDLTARLQEGRLEGWKATKIWLE
jgi:hypothetical protein